MVAIPRLSPTASVPLLAAMALLAAGLWSGQAGPSMAGLFGLLAAAQIAARTWRAVKRPESARDSPSPDPDPDAAWRAALAHAPIGVWQLDRHGRTLFGNARLAALCGGGMPASLSGSGLRLAGPGDVAGPLGLPAGREVEAELPGADGKRRTVALTASAWSPRPDPTETDPACVLTLADVGPLKVAKARLEHLTEHDPLTGLANRAQFRAALAAMCASREEGGLLLLDLDGFRRTNARHGMAAGDAVLRAAAERLRAAVRPHDMVCRLDGDEFAVVAFGASEIATVAIVERLREGLATPIRFEGADLCLNAAIGAACAPAHGSEADALLRAADLALLEARIAPEAAAIRLFRPELRVAAERRDQLREALVETIAEPEFHLAFQPQRDMQRQLLAGAEALIRWQSRRLKRAVSPGEMLPVAAEANLLPALDSWVLETALGHLAAWRGRADAPPLLSINISGVTLRDPAFADQVARGLLCHGVEPERLEIEIPEDLAVLDLADIAATLDRLRALGVRLALDDFGAGHSSLPHVVRLPVHRLKLDRSIICGLPDDPKARAVLNATMALARGMDIEVVGEGVETEAQAFALRRAGCHVLQGWLIGKPMPIDALVPPLPMLARA